MLTDITLKKLVPTAKRQEIPDGRGGVRSLYFILQPSGAKSWALRYRTSSGKPVKLTLGGIP
jgi:hypothetical protein